MHPDALVRRSGRPFGRRFDSKLASLTASFVATSDDFEHTPADEVFQPSGYGRLMATNRVRNPRLSWPRLAVRVSVPKQNEEHETFTVWHPAETVYDRVEETPAVAVSSIASNAAARCVAFVRRRSRRLFRGNPHGSTDRPRGLLHHHADGSNGRGPSSSATSNRNGRGSPSRCFRQAYLTETRFDGEPSAVGSIPASNSLVP